MPHFINKSFFSHSYLGSISYADKLESKFSQKHRNYVNIFGKSLKLLISFLYARISNGGLRMRKNRKQRKFLLKAICLLSFTIMVSGCSWNLVNVDKNQGEVWENASLTLDSNNASKEETKFDTGIQHSEMIEASETADTIEGNPIVEKCEIVECARITETMAKE